MKKTSVRAPSKTDSSLGQPPVTTTGSMPGHLRQALGQQLAAGVELVIARAVAGPAGDQDDLGRVGGLCGLATAPIDQAARVSGAVSQQLPHQECPSRVCGGDVARSEKGLRPPRISRRSDWTPDPINSAQLTPGRGTRAFLHRAPCQRCLGERVELRVQRLVPGDGFLPVYAESRPMIAVSVLSATCFSSLIGL